MKMNIGQAFFREHLMVSQIIWLAGNMACADGRLKDFWRDDPDLFRKLTGVDPEELEFDEDFILPALVKRKKEGFLVEVHTPIPQNIRGSSFCYSWGYRTAEWFYTDHLDASFLSKLIKWRQDVFHKEAAK